MTITPEALADIAERSVIAAEHASYERWTQAKLQIVAVHKKYGFHEAYKIMMAGMVAYFCALTQPGERYMYGLDIHDPEGNRLAPAAFITPENRAEITVMRLLTAAANDDYATMDALMEAVLQAGTHGDEAPEAILRTYDVMIGILRSTRIPE